MSEELKKMTVLTILICVLAAAYAIYDIYVGYPERAAQEAIAERQQSSLDLETCLDTAKSSYISSWQSECEAGYYTCLASGYSNQGCMAKYTPDMEDQWNCVLSAAEVNRWDTKLEEDEQGCYLQYPQK